MFRMQKWAVFAVMGCALSACGETPLQQALVGAGAGVTASTVANTDAATGALLGAVVNVAYCQKYPSRC